jgi:hypothetical protein
VVNYFMAQITINDTNLKIEIVSLKGHTVHGGMVAVAALCKRLGVWPLVRAERALEVRRDRTRGFAGEVLAAQIILMLCCGGVTLADAERLGEDQGLRRALGVKRFADQTTLGEWLREIGPPGVLALRRINRELVRRVLGQAAPGVCTSHGQMEIFFDDTQLEVTGPKIEGAAYNYEGHLALGWQALFVGPFLADQIVTAGATPVSAHLPALLADNHRLWAPQPSYFYADSGSSAGEYLAAVAPVCHQWGISYNRWTTPLDRATAALPAFAWTNGPDGDAFAYVRHQPAGCATPQLFAVRRWRKDGEMFDQYAFCTCEEGARTPAQVFARHQLKGEKELLFSQLLRDLDLHHPPCLSLTANQAFYSLATLAFNLLTALKLLELPVERHGWRVASLIRYLVTLPAKLSRHARGLTLRLFCTAGTLDWWRLWQARYGAIPAWADG